MSHPTASSVADERTLPVLQAQLDRMRGMLYNYSAIFYRLITLGVVVLIAMAAASMTETLRGVAFLIPFFTIWVGTQSAYYLTYTIFARVYATGIEKAINRHFGQDVLIAHRIEANYLYPLGEPQISTVQMRLKQTYIGFITVQFFILSAVIIGLSAYRAWQLIPFVASELPPILFYFPALILWSLFHLIYLFRYFGTRHYQRRIMRVVGEGYGVNYDEA
ncbi:MAG: hypothetical protein MSG64_06060 [Pyrinomonadaceae bacterium MAG19_C2-C3]|nr:hypothetical protein [Pyrinomonadaceae bacterium MAG19_C2-C3]